MQAAQSQRAGGRGELDMEDINDLVRARMEKLQLWRARGVDPFGIRYEVTHRAAEVVDGFDKLEGSIVSIAGRVMAKRGHGRAAFLDIRDLSGKIQLYASVDELGEELYQLLLELDIGDIVGVKGKVFRTRRGEVSVNLSSFTLLSKSLRPLPEKWHGLQDVELRYRQRYLDLVVNPEVRELFVKRSLIVRYIREFLDARGFLEVETPMMHPIPGGAAARPFVTHHNTLDIDLYLRIAPELYLKRLLVGGLERVYEINRCFRNEGISTRHNPEFTTVEVYQAYADYTDMMSLTENMVAFVAESVLGTPVISYGGKEVDLTPPWRRVTMVDAVKEWTGIDFNELESDAQAREICSRQGIELKGNESKWKCLNELYEAHADYRIVQPTFVTHHPVEVSPLAKKSAADPDFADRFEIFICGQELGNAFSELNDPIDQKERFVSQVAERAAGDEEAHLMDEDYVRALEYGMPPAGGLGIGVDRLTMLLTDSPSIRDVLLFPQMRPRTD